MGAFFILDVWHIKRDGYNHLHNLRLDGSTLAYNPAHIGRDICIYNLDTGRGAGNYMSSLFY
jgi:hypothetical protein